MQIHKKNRVQLFIILIWMILFGMLLQRDYFIESLEIQEEEIVKKGRQESFQGIYFQNDRIGYVKNRLSPKKDGGYALAQKAYLRLNILEQDLPVEMDVEADLNAQMRLEEFTFTLASPFYKMEARGEVEDRTVKFTLSTGKEEIHDEIRLERRPFLSTNRRAYLLKRDLQEGDRFKVPYFDPVTLTGKDTVLEYKGLEKILIKGRIYRLHHFEESFSGIRINSWINDEGKVMKEESPAGFVFISEPEFRATNIAVKGKEILSSVSVPVTGTMPDLEGIDSITYRLDFPEDVSFEALDMDRQDFAGRLLTITAEQLPPSSAGACRGPAEQLASTPYVQAKNGRITELGASLASQGNTDLEKVKILTGWVFENLEKRPVLGIPDALTTLEIKKGDCNEHAALFAALSRSIGVPTRIVAGVTFHQGAFFYHAWNEVCLDGDWISLDTTKNQMPADISHIKFVEGETREMVKIGALLGKLKIAIIQNHASDK